MRRMDARLVVGLLLIAGGVVFLLQNLGYITWGSLVWALAMVGCGLTILAAFIRSRIAWWAIIPGLTLLGLGGSLLLKTTNPAMAAAWGSSLFLGSLGLAFWLIYLRNPGMWWSIVPGGVLLTLALVAGPDDVRLPIDQGAVFILGLGLTFLLLALLPTTGRLVRWAFVPAAALLTIGVLIGVGREPALNYLWPVALIVSGLALLLRAARRQA